MSQLDQAERPTLYQSSRAHARTRVFLYLARTPWDSVCSSSSYVLYIEPALPEECLSVAIDLIQRACVLPVLPATRRP